MMTNKRQKISINNKNVKNSNSDIEADKGRLTILDLPDEIVLKIFSHLDSSCLLHRVSLVCKAWKALAEDPSLWKSLYIEDLWTRTDFVKILSKHQFVEEIRINERTIGNWILRTLSQLPRLRSLTLDGCLISNSVLKGDLRKLHLTTLNLYSSEITQIFKIIDPSVLKTLDIFGIKVKESLIESIKKCTQLENISLATYGNNKNDESINYIIDILSNRLVKFSISGAYAENSFFNLTKCLKLSVLCIEVYNSLNNSILFQIMKLSKLKDLILKPCNDITSEGIKRVFTGDQMSNLIYLTLIDCPALCDSDLITVANCCKKLSRLNLKDNCKVTDVGVSAIVNNCPEMFEIRLVYFYNLKGTFVQEIAEKNLLQNLRIMNFYSSPIERNYVVALEAARPKIQIVNEFVL